MGENDLRNLERDLGKIYDRLTSIETKLSERCDPRGLRLEKMESDIEKLKINQAKVVGAATILSLTLGYILKGLGL